MLTKCNNVFPNINGIYLNYGGKVLPPIPPWTIRLRYSGHRTPTFRKGNAVQIDADENIWDLTYENEDWSSLVEGQGGGVYPAGRNLVEVMGSNSSGVTNMYCTFSFADCKKITQLDTSNVTSMRNIFYDASHLEEIPLIDTSKVKDMYWAFYGCRSLKELPPIDTSNVSSMEETFCYCSDVSSFPPLDTSNVKYMNLMFGFCSGLQSIPDLKTTSVVNTISMFHNCVNVNSGISSFYNQLLTSPLTSYGSANHGGTFRYCGKNAPNGSAELASLPSDWK